MIWLAGVMADHRPAVRYDLLKHGHTLEQVGTALSWADAVAVLQQQPPSGSALYRALYPDTYNRDLVVDRLETLAVLLVQTQHLTGNRTGVDAKDLPGTWDDLWAKPNAPAQGLLTFDEIDARMGWSSLGVDPDSAPEAYTLDEIDQRMGW